MQGPSECKKELRLSGRETYKALMLYVGVCVIIQLDDGYGLIVVCSD